MIAKEPFAELNCAAPDAARRLLGCDLVRTLHDGMQLRVRIVETEAYDERDPASHTFRGPTPRNSIMYGRAGYLYVYFIYGMHHCCNIVTGPEGHGEAALIRAVQPLEGEPTMSALRQGMTGPSLTNGPAKLCATLAITSALNGHDVSMPPLQLQLNPPVPEAFITKAMRIGLKQGTKTPWRFYISDNAYVSNVTNSPKNDRS